MRIHLLAKLSFEQAALAWLDTRRPYLSAKTIYEYRLNIKTLTVFFGKKCLPDITADDIREYQLLRMLKCGASAINHECSVLQQMLKRMRLWTEIEYDYQPLPLPREIRGSALQDDEREKLFRVAQSKEEWLGVFCAALISINTTAGPKEIMTLRFRDIDLVKCLLRVQPEGAKNVYRMREIPLNTEALKGILLASKRARELGAYLPNHYLFPFRSNKGSEYDPTRRQTTFKTAWTKLRKEAGIRTTFRLTDLRHHAITVILENPECSEDTAEAIAGHISPAMKKKYSHIRMEAKRRAVEAMLESRGDELIAGVKKPAKSEVSSISTEDKKRLLKLLTNLLKTG